MKKMLKEIYPYIIIVAVVVLIRTFIVTPVLVKGQSMFPTLSGNELMILNKLAKIERYDIVVIDDKEEDHIIKRVYGMPGDRILCKDNTIYINNKAIEDKYGYGETEDFDQIKLEEDEYFVLGDNRIVSKDSRLIGPVKESDIKGTAKLIIFPFNKIGLIN